MKFLASLIFLGFSMVLFGQTATKLSLTIDSMVTADQYWRNLRRQVGNQQKDTLSIEYIDLKMIATDSLNRSLVKRIFDEFGYPGFDLVGEESSHNFWVLVQHQDNDPKFQERVLEEMMVESFNGNASLNDYAYLVDRVKVNKGELQLYGTQMELNPEQTSYVAKPMFEPDKINERRKSVKLPPLEFYIKAMNERFFGTLKKQ